MSAKDIREGIARFFGGSTFDPVTRYYQPTPLAALGLAGVKAYYSDQIEDHDYLTGLADGSTVGAVVCVHLAESTETRLASAILNSPYAVELHLWYLAVAGPPEDAEAFRDGLVQAIKDRMRADPTLGRVVIQAGETERGVTVSTPIPYTEPSSYTRGGAVVSFHANTYPFL